MSSKLSHIFCRLSAKLYTRWVVARHEQTTAEGLTYVLQECGHSSWLVVSFPGCNDKAVYNYVATLRGEPCHRLFLLDNFASNHLGNYLMRSDVEQAVIRLIEQTAQRLGAKQLAFIGSSKGASAALNFGFQLPQATLCIAAPQYYLGDYLWDGIVYRENLKDILGHEPDPESIASLNRRLSHLVLTSPHRPAHVYLHFSDSEHTYAEHVRPLLEDLRQAKVPVSEDVEHYPRHEELRHYYPAYLRQTLSSLLNSSAQ